MFIIFNKDKILSYLISISTVTILLVLSVAITKNNEEILKTSTNAVTNNIIQETSTNSLNQKQNIIMNNVKNENQTTETDSKVQKTNEIDNTVTTMTNTSNESQKGYSEAKNVHNN